MNKTIKLVALGTLMGTLSVHARAEQSADAELEPTNEVASAIETPAAETVPVAVMTQSESATNSSLPDWTQDVASRIQLHGYAQGGYFWNNQGDKNTNSFEIKRVLFWANAQITDRWSFLFMHDFSSVVQEYYTDYRLTNNKALTVRLGQFKNCLSYENPLSPTSQELIDVYSESVTFLTGCGSDPLFGVQYGRDLGMSLYGETNDGGLRYELQVMNGQGINIKDKNNQKDLIGRLEFKPVKGLNLVATGQIGRGCAVKESIYNPDIKVGQTYDRNRYTVGFDYKSKPVNVHGEYLEGKDGEAISRGAYVTGAVKLAKFKHDTSLDFVGSYDFFNFNTSLGMDQHKFVAGLQYWYFKKCRFQVNYTYKNAYTAGGQFVHGAYHGIQCQMQVRFN